MELEGQVAIVTGGGGGLGEGIGRRLARAGAHVVVSDIDAATAEAVAGRIREAGHAASVAVTDVTRADECRRLVADTIAAHGRLDTLVCNAGVDGLPRDEAAAPPLIENIREADWDVVMDVNLKGVFLCCAAAVPHFKQTGHGRIINIASVAGRQGMDLLPAYAASKAGVISLTQSIALQLAPYHVNVNCICPGIIWTPMWERLARYLARTTPAFAGATPEAAYDAVVKQMIPFGKPQTPDDIGESVLFLASDAASEITGQSLNVCGGIRLN